MGTQGTGRKRNPNKERSTAEDNALNLIAREAEARLAAKRAARAEAREIRMKELERQQKEIFQVQKKYYGLDTKLDDRADSKWGDIEQWMEDSERYSRPSRIHTLSDDDERMSVGSRGSVRSDLDAVGAYGGGGSSSHSHKKSKKKKKHKHKDRDSNGCDDGYSAISSRSSRLSDESRVSRSSRIDLTSSRLSDDSRVSRASRLDLQPASYASSDLYSLNGLSSSRQPGSTYNGYQSSLYEDSPCGGLRRVTGSSARPSEYSSYRSSGSRASSRASSARASPVDNCSSVASFLRSSSGLPRDLDDVTIPDFSEVEDRDYLEKGSRAASTLTTATLTSLGGTSSRRGSGETAITVDTEASIREIKEIHELKDQIQDVETKYMQNLKEVKDAFVEVEEKYRKAMVSNAQLDNEKNNLMYQVDTLKDSLMELEELLSESRREHEEKVKDYEREKHNHSVLQFQFSEMKETLKQSEELLNEIRQLRMKQDGFVREVSDLQETVEWKDKKIGALERQKEYTDAIRLERDELRDEVVKLKDIVKKHGIVLGPDLNIIREVVEAETDGSSSGDPASRLAQESQTTPTEGNSMLGSAQETQLRSSGEEELDPEQHQEMLEEAKESHLSSTTPCNLPSVSTLETSGEEQQTCIPVVGDRVGENGLNMHRDIEMNDLPVTDVKNITVCNSEFQKIVTSPEEKVTGTERVECQDLGEMSEGAIGTQKVSIADSETIVIKSSDAIRETSCKDLSEEDSIPAISNTKPQHEAEAENAEDAENEELEEISNKSQPQGATAPGKKKKKKKRGKKRKGGTVEGENQKIGKKAKSKTEKENSKTEKDLELAARDNGPATEPEIVGAPVETPKELQMDQVKDEQDKQLISETEKAEAVESVSPVTESNLSTTNLTDNSITTKSTDDDDTECISTVDDCTDGIEISTKTGVLQIESEVIDSAKDEAGSINDVRLESTTHNSENGLEITNCNADVLDPSNVDVVTDKSESKDDKLLAPSNTDSFTDCLESLSGSEVPLESNQSTTTNSGNDSAVMLSDGAPLEVTETVKDEEEPGVEMEQKSFSCNVTAANHENDYSELRLEGTGKEELNEGLKEPEDSLQPDNSSVPFPTDAENCDSCDNASSMKQDDAFVNENIFSETVIQAEHFDDVSGCPVESQGLNTPQCVNQNDDSNAEVSLETKDTDTMEILQIPDSVKEVPEIGFFIEKDHSDGGLAIAEDPEHKNSQDDQESETFPSPMEKQQHESNKDKPEDNDSSQLIQADSDEEEDEDEEGQSFDFDDLDLEAAANVTLETPQEEVEKGVEIMSEEVKSGDGETNEDLEPQLQTHEEPVESNEEKCTVDEVSKVDTLEEELASVSQEHQNSMNKEEAISDKGGDERKEEQNTAEKEIGGEDDLRHLLEEVGSVGELSNVESDSVEKVNQALFLPVEEGEQAIKDELQVGEMVIQNTEEQVGSNIEPPLSKNDSKKAKKGKSKGKEDCKMS